MAPELSFGWLFLKTMLAMVFVIALAFVSIRYLVPRMHASRVKSIGNIEILDRIALEPRKNLFVIRVGDKHALIAVSEQGIAKLMDLTAQDIEDSGGRD